MAISKRVFEDGEIHGLGEVLIESGLDGSLSILGLAVAGQCDQGDVAQLGVVANGACYCVACHFWKAQVTKDRIDVMVLQECKGGRTPVDGCHVVASRREQVTHHLGGVCTVLDKQDILCRDPTAWLSRRFCRRSTRERKADMKLGARSLPCAVGPDIAIVQLDQAFGQSQAKAKTTGGP